MESTRDPEEEREEGSEDEGGLATEFLRDQPGLKELREAVANRLEDQVPGRRDLRRDGVAGLTTAINNVPDGMANGLLVGVNPVYGLYATMIGPFVGGIFSSTGLMIISTTAAASLTTSQALMSVPFGDRQNALLVLVILTGIFLTVFGLLGLGKLIRFVSYSVTTGFLLGVSVLLMLSQLPTVTGYEAEGDNRVSQTLDLFANLGEINQPSLIIGLIALVIALVLPRTPVGNFGRLVAIVVPSVLLPVLQIDSVEIVKDVGDIPGGVPLPVLPPLSALSFDVATGALAVAVVILVQGSGVSQSVPNPSGATRSTSRDFVAQGAANIASGFFRGLPVGGSLSATALNVISGASTRWAAIFAGLFMAVFVIVLPGVVSYIAMPALGALLILAGASGIKPGNIRAILNVGWPSILAAATTFLSTLVLPIQAAVGIGVVLSALLYVIRSSTDISVVEVIERPDGRLEERSPADRLESNSITVLDVYGDLFYAGISTLERQLPDPQGAENTVVILRLRGRSSVGATLIDMLSMYADTLKAANGRLYLTGISSQAHDQLLHAGKLDLYDTVHMFDASSVIGQSTRAAYAEARAWLESQGIEVNRSGGEA